MSQPTRFWRFSYDSDASVDLMIASGVLQVPTSGIRSNKYNPEKVIAEQIKIGDGILLGKLHQGSEIGHIVAIGIARSAKPACMVDWKKFTRDVYPTPGGGIAPWKERCFLFNGGPADRYNLAGDFLSKFPGE